MDRLLGEGASGVVYAGVHLVLGQPIAIKCLKPSPGCAALAPGAHALFPVAPPPVVRATGGRSLLIAAIVPAAPPSAPPVTPHVTPAHASVRITRVLFAEPQYKEDQAKTALEARMPDLMGCYAAALKNDFTFAGEMTLWAQADDKGTMDLTFAGLSNHDFETCLRDRASRWRFPSTRTDGVARPQYRLMLAH